MGTYRKEWDCCGSVTETDAWEPDHCPFCTEVAAPFRKDAERYRNLREASSALKLYVYEDKADPFSGDWQYKPSPEDVDTFADGIGAA